MKKNKKLGTLWLDEGWLTMKGSKWFSFFYYFSVDYTQEGRKYKEKHSTKGKNHQLIMEHWL